VTQFNYLLTFRQRKRDVGMGMGMGMSNQEKLFPRTLQVGKSQKKKFLSFEIKS
jgi:hypothetical protein